LTKNIGFRLHNYIQNPVLCFKKAGAVAPHPTQLLRVGEVPLRVDRSISALPEGHDALAGGGLVLPLVAGGRVQRERHVDVLALVGRQLAERERGPEHLRDGHGGVVAHLDGEVGRLGLGEAGDGGAVELELELALGGHAARVGHREGVRLGQPGGQVGVVEVAVGQGQGEVAGRDRDVAPVAGREVGTGAGAAEDERRDGRRAAHAEDRLGAGGHAGLGGGVRGHGSPLSATGSSRDLHGLSSPKGRLVSLRIAATHWEKLYRPQIKMSTLF